jgi:hypothetical protein
MVAKKTEKVSKNGAMTFFKRLILPAIFSLITKGIRVSIRNTSLSL